MRVFIIVVAFFFAGLLFGDSASLGKIDFPNSGSPAAQEQFLRGVLLLHSFEYEDARESFRQAQALDPDFAMAFWGEAMTYNHAVWVEVDLEKARGTLTKLGASKEERAAKVPTEREKGYLEAVEILYGEGDKIARDEAYAESMKNLSQKYPNDLEAASFYSLALLGSCQTKRDYPVYMEAAAVSEEVYGKNPKHPGAVHYLIHSYDDPVHASLGLRPARVYAQVAPSAAHALHMPSHIFLALGMWDDVIASNQASWAAADARMQSKKLGVDARGFHALHWLEYGYLQQGRDDEAMKALVVMEEDAKKSGSTRTRWHLTAMRAAYVVETQDWKGSAAAMKIDTSGLDFSIQGTDLFVTGLSALKTGNAAAAQKALADMKSSRKTATSKMKDQDTHPCHAYSRYEQTDIEAVQVMEKELEALLLLSEGKGDEAVKLMLEAVAIEDSMNFEFGPPLPVKPIHELFGEVLLELKRPGEAQIQFEAALSRTPGRALSLKGLEECSPKLEAAQ